MVSCCDFEQTKRANFSFWLIDFFTREEFLVFLFLIGILGILTKCFDLKESRNVFVIRQKQELVKIRQNKLVWLINEVVKKRRDTHADSKRISTIARNFKEYRRKTEELLVSSVVFWYLNPNRDHKYGQFLRLG